MSPSFAAHARRSPFATLSAAALLLGSASAFVLGAQGCGSDSYSCDANGCYQCDGYGCSTITPPTATPCTVAGDPVCKGADVCTDLGCLTPCKVDAECVKGTVCRAGYCAAPTATKDPSKKLCGVAADCGPSGFECVDGACVAAPACTGVGCTCKYSSECGPGRLCVDSACVKKCDASTACEAGFTCGPLGTCIAQATATCGAAAATKDATCKSGEHCVDGHCSSGCTADADCKGAGGARDPSLSCLGGACVINTKPATNCTGDTQCTGGSQKCLDGFCRYTCASDDECKKIDARIGSCSKAPESVCRSSAEVNAKCTAKTDCNASQSCVDGQCV